MPSDLHQYAQRRPEFGPEKSITELGVLEFAGWMLESGDGSERDPIRLPAIQRTALWNPERIINLWDSILRGLPIGMFYLIRPASGTYSRPFPDALGKPAITIPSSGTGFELLDGQQRALAILLGRRSPRVERRCLWVDLGQSDSNLLLCLRLTSQSQPFGYDERGGKLPLYQRQQARNDFDGSDDAPDNAEGNVISTSGVDHKKLANHELFDAMLNAQRQSRPLKPFRSISAAPLNEVLSAWIESGEDPRQFGSQIETVFQKPINDLPQFDMLLQAMKSLSSGRIGLLLVKRPDDPDTDWLLRLFERIGAGGVPLTDAERLYSIYKHHEPFVHDVVTQIERRIGRIMSPVDIAGTALRISNARSSSRGYDTPSVILFAKEMQQPESSLKLELHKLIPTAMTLPEEDGRQPDRADCELSEAFELLTQIVIYSEDLPYGLPKAMLVELPRDLIQVLVFWIILAKPYKINDRAKFKEISGEIIRFILFWRLCSLDDRKMGLQSYAFLSAQAHLEAFPGLGLYNFLTGMSAGGDEGLEQSRCAIQMASPIHLRSYAPRSNSDKWLEFSERFERTDGVDFIGKELYKYWWDSGGKMLIWLQRDYIATKFENYDPASGRDDDKPFDLDHLQPQSYFKYVGIGDAARYNNFLKTRHILMNGIGNLRWFDSSENRSFGDVNVVCKLKLNDHSPSDKWNFSGFNGEDENVRQAWKDAAVSSEKTWTAPNMTAFQDAVEERTLWLYEQFWSQASFAKWLLGSE